jgi:hypothetical protein
MPASLLSARLNQKLKKRNDISAAWRPGFFWFQFISEEAGDADYTKPIP